MPETETRINASHRLACQVRFNRPDIEQYLHDATTGSVGLARIPCQQQIACRSGTSDRIACKGIGITYVSPIPKCVFHLFAVVSAEGGVLVLGLGRRGTELDCLGPMSIGHAQNDRRSFGNSNSCGVGEIRSVQIDDATARLYALRSDIARERDGDAVGLSRLSPERCLGKGGKGKHSDEDRTVEADRRTRLHVSPT